MSVTSRDIAREIGLSQSTVSRALRGDPRVAPETLERVRAAAERLRYVPDAAARMLSSGRTQTVGVVVADILNPFYPEIVEVLHSELRHEGYATVLLNEPLGPDLASQLGGRTVDGLIVVAATLDAAFVARLPAIGIPLVLLNRYVDDADTDRVLSDNVAGGALAVEHLIGLGHRRIGLIAGPANTSTARDREQGLRAALERHDVPFDASLRREGSFTHESGYQHCSELLRLPQPPSAIVCASDVIAFGALDAAKRLGVAVPQQLSVIGYDDVAMAAWEAFALTTIRQPLTRMAKRAVRVLLERLQAAGAVAPAAPQREIFPPQLVKRETTAPPPGA
ncbi:LacI family DNA-binding transcriptional regulator [Conexibacter sp. JD483]|uniref:LacI family DNA-binding transcriptional regulator n=1 Tax=unclassified Conexibacter TaxID=2627773 RepID=UPI0027235927|nr:MULTISPECIES: LacI family DNA-binding transcriptional regulator [unclassified Conexibacter]MDO8186313.1 LacI family DNA-binding transcriptional regulator [Conexibacter sp. CPCC 205706]MDO8197518.1 LacI family DNA-binding transcriptional regulator [Conexibacter sp. CPCC 205762]MDR9369660.1 LacI family DNA-binding transcriptional regulator [Conexibacter sp. JD483]